MESQEPIPIGNSPASDLDREVVLLYQEHAVGLYRYAETFTLNRDAARDAVQEVFLRYFAERRYGSRVETPRAWLYRVLRNYVLDQAERASARFEVSAAGADRVADESAGAELILESRQAAHQIEARLSCRELECLRLRAEGFSYLEIAEIMGIRIGTVGALLARVHTKLRLGAREGVFRSECTGGALNFLLRGGHARRS